MIHPKNNSHEDRSGSSTKWWVAATITLLNAATMSGFAIVGLVDPGALVRGGDADSGAKMFAMYAAARTLPLAVITAWLVWRRARGSLGVLAGILGAIQLCDAIVGSTQHDGGKTFGPLVLGLATLAAVPWLWSKDPWGRA